MQRKTLSSALTSENVLDEFASSLEKLVEEAERKSAGDNDALLSSSAETLAEWMCDLRAFIEDVSDAAKDAILASVVVFVMNLFQNFEARGTKKRREKLCKTLN